VQSRLYTWMVAGAAWWLPWAASAQRAGRGAGQSWFESPVVIAVGVVIVVAVVIKLRSGGAVEEGGPLPDDMVDRTAVESALRGFRPDWDDKLKYGYTEKRIQKQMCQYLRERFETVTTEYKIGGIRGTQIDLLVGDVSVSASPVGVEIKLARSLAKTAELQRLYGQLADYAGPSSPFQGDNLVVIVVAEAEHVADTARIKEIQDKVAAHGACSVIVEIGPG